LEVKRLWKGDQPTPRDLLREMEHPSQVTMEWDKYYIARRLLPLSATSAVMIQEAASKPPDFEPQLTPDGMKDLPAKVSKRISRPTSKRVLSKRRRK
jgi:hypothetical protein